ncbi:MAG: damage-inducible protein DinB [Paenibacillus sp.]|jgi:uncharacterized damage-inducible protein DinB|nr:damage-inducible protein DinB [Paenibacillus sp.]
MTNHPANMYHYHVWANQTIIGRIKELPNDVLSQEVNSSFPTIAHALSHIYAIDKTWYLVLTGTGMPEAMQACGADYVKVYDTADEYAELYAKLSEQVGQWLGSGVDVEQTILLDNPFAGPRETRLSEIVLHLVNHGTYHRGNISTMLRQQGHASVMNDYSLYWYQRPEASSL